MRGAVRKVLDFLPQNGAFCVHFVVMIRQFKKSGKGKQIISASVFKVISISVSVSFLRDHVYRISIENLLSISFSMSFTDINHFSISLSFSYWNVTSLHQIHNVAGYKYPVRATCIRIQVDTYRRNDFVVDSLRDTCRHLYAVYMHMYRPQNCR